MPRFLTASQIKQLSQALDAARQTFDCNAPRHDAAGGYASESGVSYGTHGSAFLQIDADTGEVQCGACRGGLDATVTPKKEVRYKVGGRVHRVSVSGPR